MNIKEIGKQCTGCKVCSEVCPVKAITFSETYREGYWYPAIHEQTCVDCGKCLTVCPVRTADDKDEVKEVIACQNRNKNILSSSTSGGVFYPLAADVLKRGGVVYGAALDNTLNCVHQRVSGTDGISALQGSKYVQSDMEGIYQSIADDLKDGVEVLFSGTACQVAGLLHLVEQKHVNTDHLTTVEILCYGVPSPELFREHLSLLNSKVGLVKNWKFRDKQLTKGNHYVDSLVVESGEKRSDGELIQALQFLFNKHYSMRESCFTCGFYREKKSGADLTIGDCWGAETLCPEWDAEDGVSQVIIHSDKGQKIWDAVKEGFDRRMLDFEDVKKYNGIYRANAQRPGDYREFWDYYDKNGYEKTIQKYSLYGKTYAVRNKLGRIKKKFLGN